VFYLHILFFFHQPLIDSVGCVTSSGKQERSDRKALLKAFGAGNNNTFFSTIKVVDFIVVVVVGVVLVAVSRR